MKCGRKKLIRRRFADSVDRIDIDWKTGIIGFLLPSRMFAILIGLFRNARWPAKAVMVVLFFLLSTPETSRHPSHISKSPADYSVFLKGTLYRVPEMPESVNKMLQGENTDIDLLAPELVKFIRTHPISLESKWALNALNRSFMSGKNGIESHHLSGILSLCDPVFVVLNVDEDMKIWLLHILQRYMGHSDIAEKKKVFDSILVYAPYLIERGPSSRIKIQAVDSLRTFAEHADFEMLSLLFDASFDLLKDEAIPYKIRLELENALRRVSFRYVMDMRFDHLERRLPDEEISNKLTAITGNDPVKLYAFFTDPWMYGTLAEEVFSRLEEHSRLAGQRLYAYLERLDPLKHFFESFLFSAINFNKSNRWFQTEDTVKRSFHYMFREISRDSLTANAALTQVFIERLLVEKSPYFSWKCQQILLDEYRQSFGFHRYFIAATLVLHRELFDTVDDETADVIAQENAIDLSKLPSDQIDYSQILAAEKRPVLNAYVIFADTDSLAYHRSAVRMFTIRGYRYISRDDDRIVLEKRGRLTMRVIIAKRTEGFWRLGDEAASDPRLKIVMIRGHNGIQGKVFSGAGSGITAGTHIVLSLCRGMFEASRYRFKYHGTHWIAAKSSVAGIMANAIMVSLIDGFRLKKPTYSSIKAEAIRLSPATHDFVFPNEPAFVIGSLLRQMQK
ncbi:MAG: hypothetical protein JXA73_23595 [Acidobacteria bacterium]|nr:hypothetical protein [Acidobacteriota bacterium]